MKKLLVLFYLLACTSVFAQEPIKVVNPDENTKVEIILTAPAREFSLDLDIVKGLGDFEVILCNEQGTELKRTIAGQNGEYNFGTVDKGKYFLKFKNNLQIPEIKEDKAAPFMQDLPYIRK